MLLSVEAHFKLEYNLYFKRCYLSEADMNSLQLYPSTKIALINTEKKKICICSAWTDSKAKQGTIQLSNADRRTLSTQIGDNITISIDLSQFSVQIATKIQLKPSADYPELDDEIFIAFVKAQIVNHELFTSRETLEFWYKSSFKQFSIEQELDELVLATASTTVEIVNKIAVKADGFSRLAGLNSEIEQIRESVQVALFEFQKFTKFNLIPTQGLLVHGPPGVGKTRLATSIEHEFPVHFMHLNPCDILSSFVGESEANLERLFSNACKREPAVVLIDDIDILCGQSELKIAAQLCAAMDKIRGKRVFVVATTNSLDSVPFSLRRPGRFEKELQIDIPSPISRREILQKLLETSRNSIAFSQIDELAVKKAHGYTGADLEALVKQAGFQCLARLDSQLDATTHCRLEYVDLVNALKLIKPSAMKEISLEVPRVYWSDIGGQQEIKSKLREAVELPIKQPELFKEYGIEPPKGLLLYGPPGCSKTLMAKALATESGLNFIAVKGPELFNKYVGESEKAVRNVFKKARSAAPSIIFFDEIDSIGSKRGSDQAVSDRVLSQLLTEMDGIEGLENVTIVAATNRPDMMDSALLRPGRFDRVLYVGPPDLQARKSIIEIWSKNSVFDKDVDISLVASKCDGFSGAEVAALCREAAMQALVEDINIDAIHYRHFEKSLNLIKPQITREMIDFYHEFRTRNGLAAV